MLSLCHDVMLLSPTQALRMAYPLLAVLLVAVVCSVVVQGTPSVGSIRTHKNGSVLIASPVNGSVLLNGNNPLAEIAALHAENARLVTKNAHLEAKLGTVQRAVAGLGNRQWTYQFGTSGDNQGYGAAAAEGFVYVTGTTQGGLDGNSNSGDYDMFVTRISASGLKAWTRQLGSSNFDGGRAAACDAAGDVYIVGDTLGGLDGHSNAGTSGYDFFVAKYDSSGAKQWTRQFGTSGDDQGLGAAADGDGNIYAVGFTTGVLDGNSHAGGEDVCVVKFNSAGVKQWTRLLGSGGEDRANGVATDRDGNVYVAGETQGGLDGNANAGGYDMFVAKYNSSGHLQWSRQLGTTSFDVGRACATDGNGNVYVAGETEAGIDGNGYGGTSTDLFVTKYNALGEKQWTRQLGTSVEERVRGVAADFEGSVYVAGFTLSGLDDNVAAGGYDVFLTKYSPMGVKQWTRQIGTTATDRCLGASSDSDGNIYLVGDTNGPLDMNSNAGGYDIFVTKYGLP